MADGRREAIRLGSHRVEDARGLARARAALRVVAAVAEQPLEDDARMIFGEIRCRLVTPRDGVDVEAVARVASALCRRVDRELERAYGRVEPKHVGCELVGRRRELDLDAGLRAVVRVHAREPG